MSNKIEIVWKCLNERLIGYVYEITSKQIICNQYSSIPFHSITLLLTFVVFSNAVAVTQKSLLE